MLVIASALFALAGWVAQRYMGTFGASGMPGTWGAGGYPAMMRGVTPMMGGAPWYGDAAVANFNALQLYIINFVSAFIILAIGALIMHVILRIITEKGSFNDAMKVTAVGAYVASVYVLISAVIVAFAPEMPTRNLIGMLFAAVGSIFTIAIVLKGFAQQYKTDIVTAWISATIAFVGIMPLMHIVMLSYLGND